MTRFMNMFWHAIGALLFVVVAMEIYDRFTWNDTYYTFYDHENDLTCMVVKTEGRQVMDCLEGDVRQEEGK